MILPFTPYSIVFEKIHYSVDMPLVSQRTPNWQLIELEEIEWALSNSAGDEGRPGRGGEAPPAERS